MFRPTVIPFGEEETTLILKRLLEYAKGPGAPLNGVWCDAGVLKIRRELWETPVHLSWPEAAIMTGVRAPAMTPAIARKPPANSLVRRSARKLAPARKLA